MKDKFLCAMAQYNEKTEQKLKKIQKALPYVAENFKSFKGRIESISLYEFWPIRFILEEKFL